MANYLLLTVWLWSVAHVECIKVPEVWNEAINALCREAESGVFPHPTPSAQILYGRVTISDVVTKQQVSLYMLWIAV